MYMTVYLGYFHKAFIVNTNIYTPPENLPNYLIKYQNDAIVYKLKELSIS